MCEAGKRGDNFSSSSWGITIIIKKNLVVSLIMTEAEILVQQ